MATKTTKTPAKPATAVSENFKQMLKKTPLQLAEPATASGAIEADKVYSEPELIDLSGSENIAEALKIFALQGVALLRVENGWIRFVPPAPTLQ